MPHRESEYNLSKAKQAFEHYQAAMKCDPGLSPAALQGMAYLNVLMDQPAEACEYYRQLLKIQDKYRDTYYAIAMCDLEQAQANTRSEKTRLNVNPGESMADSPACPALRKQNLPLLEDGLQMLSKAMWLGSARDGVDQVAASVIYHERAEIECGDPEARKADEKNSAYWTDLALKAAATERDATKEREATRQ